jgi:hypothetical protein
MRRPPGKEQTMRRLAVLASADPPEPAGPGASHARRRSCPDVTLPREHTEAQATACRGGARMRPGSRVTWTGNSARLYRVRGRAPSQNAGARRCCTCSPAVKAAGLVPSRGGCSSAGVVRRCDRRGVDGWVKDGCPGQTARLTGVACLSVPCTPRAVLSRPRPSHARGSHGSQQFVWQRPLCRHAVWRSQHTFLWMHSKLRLSLTPCPH